MGCEQLDGLEAAGGNGCVTLSESREQKPCQAMSVPCTRISSAQDMHHQQGQQQQSGQQLLSADHLYGNGQPAAAPASRTRGSGATDDDLGTAEDTERPSGPRAASAAAVVGGGGGGAAGGGGAGAKIVVRRRFARQLQPAVLSVTRWVCWWPTHRDCRRGGLPPVMLACFVACWQV